jgi:hypothetical protein
MSNALATKNNNEAARLAAIRGTPYVPWNAAETRELDFPKRIPYIGKDEPKGWQRLTTDRCLHSTVETTVTKWINANPTGTLGFAIVWLPDGWVALGIFKPLPEAHEPRKAEW